MSTATISAIFDVPKGKLLDEQKSFVRQYHALSVLRERAIREVDGTDAGTARCWEIFPEELRSEHKRIEEKMGACARGVAFYLSYRLSKGRN